MKKKKRFLGRGMSSTVYLIDGYACKQFKEEHLDILPQEVENMKRLKDTYPFVQYVDHTDTGIRMEYINGKCLGKYKLIQVEWIEELKKAFDAALSKGLLIRDLHYQNILIDANNHVRIVDLMDYVDSETADAETRAREEFDFYQFINELECRQRTGK